MAEVQAAAPAAEPNPIAAIDAILAGENKPAPVEVPDDEIAEPTGEPDVEGADAPEPEQQAAPDEAAADDKPAMAEIPLEQLEAVELEVSVKGDDGKDVAQKLTVKELREGYMRQKDYSRKTAEVARQREEVSESVRKAVESERNQYVQNLKLLQQTLISTVAPELQNVDWNTLAQTDAFEYVRLKNRADQINQAISSIQAKTQEVTTKQANEQRAAQAKLAATARSQLEEKIPGWNDTVYQSLMKEGQNYGFKAEEIGTWLDPRAIQVLHDAVQYRKMQTPVTGKKLVVAPKVLKPGAAQSVTRTQAQAADAMKRLQSSGNITDAADAIRARMR